MFFLIYIHLKINNFFFFSDTIYNVSIKTFKTFSVYKWKPKSFDIEDCKMKKLDQVSLIN